MNAPRLTPHVRPAFIIENRRGNVKPARGDSRRVARAEMVQRLDEFSTTTGRVGPDIATIGA